VVPWDSANPYYDNEFAQEFAGICPPQPSPSPNTPSVWNQNPLSALPFPGPLYKWVRINGITEQSLQLDTSPYDGIDASPVLNAGGNLTDLAPGNQQVLEVTALAVLPNGSRKLLQYLIAPLVVNLPTFPAALTLLGGPGNTVTFNASSNPSVN